MKIKSPKIKNTASSNLLEVNEYYECVFNENVSEEITIKDLAMKLASLSNDKPRVVFEIPKESNGYCNYKRVGLNTKKLEKLGWYPKTSLIKGLNRTVLSFREDKV